MSTIPFRRTLASALLSLVSLAATALPPVTWNQRYQAYIDRYRDLAVYEMLSHGIPASITMAQGLLESNAGDSQLSRQGNNHFGIKCHDWTGRTMRRDDDAPGECFRVYNSAFESYEDHSRFLERPRYQRLFSLRRTDYEGWARGLRECGYATNPRYAQLLIDIIRCYRLDALDRERTYDMAQVRGTGKGSVTIVPQKFVSHNAAATAHQVFMCNRNYYVVVRRGDTFKSIGKEFGISWRKLARYNERDRKSPLYVGDRVYFEKKRKKADRQYRRQPHTVRAGESMYSIAQTYGIRLSSLYKKNGLTPDYTMRVGDKLRVY